MLATHIEVATIMATMPIIYRMPCTSGFIIPPPTAGRVEQNSSWRYSPGTLFCDSIPCVPECALGFLLCFQVCVVQCAAMYFIEVLTLAVVLQGGRIGNDETRRDDAEKEKKHSGNGAEIPKVYKAIHRIILYVVHTGPCPARPRVQPGRVGLWVNPSTG